MSKENEPIEGELVDTGEISETASAAKATKTGNRKNPARNKTTAKKAGSRKSSDSVAGTATETAAEEPQTSKSESESPEKPTAAPVAIETSEPEAETTGDPTVTPLPVETASESSDNEGPILKSADRNAMVPSAIAIALFLGVVGFAVYKSVDLSPITVSAPESTTPTTTVVAADEPTTSTAKEPTLTAQGTAVDNTAAVETVEGPAGNESLAQTVDTEDDSASATMDQTAAVSPAGDSSAGTESESVEQVAQAQSQPATSDLSPPTTQPTTTTNVGWDRVMVSFMNPFNYVQMAGYAMTSVMQAWNVVPPPPTTN